MDTMEFEVFTICFSKLFTITPGCKDVLKLKKVPFEK